MPSATATTAVRINFEEVFHLVAFVSSAKLSENQKILKGREIISGLNIQATNIPKKEPKSNKPKVDLATPKILFIYIYIGWQERVIGAPVTLFVPFSKAMRKERPPVRSSIGFLFFSE